MAAVLAVFCMLGNGARLLGAPASDGERLTAGVGQILDSVPEEDQEEEESGERMDDKRLQDGMAGEAEAMGTRPERNSPEKNRRILRRKLFRKVQMSLEQRWKALLKSSL